MTTDLTLFDAPPHPRYRHTDHQTSVDAAKSVGRGVEGQILDVFAREPHPWFMGGLTDDELAARLPTYHAPTVRTARSRLSNRGLLVDSGERRPSDRGRAQIVWAMPDPRRHA